MAQPALPVPDTHHDTSPESRDEKAPVYLVIVWNDPVNLMQYVTHVFQRVFGWDRQTAERHMMEVHTQGRSTVARDSMEKAELYVHQLQSFSLHATMEREQA